MVGIVQQRKIHLDRCISLGKQANHAVLIRRCNRNHISVNGGGNHTAAVMVGMVADRFTAAGNGEERNLSSLSVKLLKGRNRLNHT